MELFQNDMWNLGNHLKILNERMVLTNPKFDNKQQDGPLDDTSPSREQ